MVRNKTQSSSSSSSSGNASNSSSTKSPIRQNTHRKSSSTCSVALIDDVKPSTSSTRRSPNSSPDDDTDDYDTTPVTQRTAFGSVHKQNLYVVSFPIIFLFNILRTLIYQLFCIFRYLYGASTKVIYRPHKRECNIEIVVGSPSSTGTAQNSTALTTVTSKDRQQLLEQGHQNASSTTIAPYPLVGSQRIRPQQQLEMFNRNNAIASGPGPGDPLLAKQKHHHRRAFEYISKALKIDEENEGKQATLRFFLFVSSMF